MSQVLILEGLVLQNGTSGIATVFKFRLQLKTVSTRVLYSFLLKFVRKCGLQDAWHIGD
jgi:hypothetical protein